ncbi:hypothetical protein CLAIMM_02232 [Cladophialophora immunda]|nr:hypothetical protein CLAIMM_02232 [Cladophialophora immunda]
MLPAKTQKRDRSKEDLAVLTLEKEMDRLTGRVFLRDALEFQEGLKNGTCSFSHSFLLKHGCSVFGRLINQIDSKSSFPRNAQEGDMVNAFLYGASSTVMDFILLGRNSGVQAVLRRAPAKNKFGDVIGRLDTSEDSVTALVRQMDGITDAKMIREAEVFRMTLVGCE